MLNATVVALTWMAQICGIYFIPNYPDVGPLVNATWPQIGLQG